MGANCCVALRDKPLPEDPRVEVPVLRNIRCSPSWSFRWDNRTHIEDIMDIPGGVSGHGSGDVDSEVKSGSEIEAGGVSGEGSPMDVYEKPPAETGINSNYKDGSADQSIESHSSPEEKEPIKSTVSTSASENNASVISIPSSSSINLDPSSSRTRSLPPGLTSSWQERRSPGYDLSRQVSDSRILSLKSLNEDSSPEARKSFVFSTPGNDLSVAGSHGGSSDGWSMRAFTELMASSQRDRWSFDSGYTSSIEGKLARSNTHPSPSVFADLQTCGVCSKLLKERASITHKYEISTVAVLVCGHVCHAECLESVTAETDRFEPPCPVCGDGEKSIMKWKDEMKARSKISRNAVVDVDGGFGPISACQKDGRLGASSSMKSSFVRPLFRRHFSLGPRPSRSASQNDTTRKKGLWTKNWRD